MTTKPLFVDTPFLQIEPTTNEQEAPLSVTELSLSLKACVEEKYSFVRVKGEISGLKKASSGHIYFSLKDEESVLDSVCWRTNASRLGIMPQDGLEVVCTGKITTYTGRSKYQLIVETLQAAGVGALLKLLEERRLKLQAEGLFDPGRKKKIPFLPQTIGVITSPSGAVIRDIIHRLQERFPCHVLLWPSLMQGDGCAEQVAQAIKGFNAIEENGLMTPDGIIPRPDVIIVARGGGSLEDLWPFNEEIVVRAAANSQIPLISAVGHETDTTLIDYAADLRAPTPTGAAEKAVPVRNDLRLTLSGYETRLKTVLYRLINEHDNIVKTISRALPSLKQNIEEKFQKIDDKTERLNNAVKTFIINKTNGLNIIALKLTKPDFLVEQAKNKLFQQIYPLASLIKSSILQKETQLQTAARLLDGFSYERILERGFALVLTTDGKPVEKAREAALYQELDIKFSDDVLRVSSKGGKGKNIIQKKTKKTEDNKQGRLL